MNYLTVEHTNEDTPHLSQAATSPTFTKGVIPAKVGTRKNIICQILGARTLRKAKLTQSFSNFRDDAGGGGKMARRGIQNNYVFSVVL